MSQSTSSRRMADIDFVRGFCILCVHLGHSGVKLPIPSILWNTFYMSAFFIFSGFFYKPGSLVKLLKSTLLLYYLWTLGLHAALAIPSVLRRTFSADEWLSWLKPILLGLDQPQNSSQLWFLMALFMTRLFWHVIDRTVPSFHGKLLAAATLGIAGIVLHSLGIRRVPFRVVTAMIMLPVYAFGYALGAQWKRDGLEAAISRGARFPAIALLLALWCLGTWLHYHIAGRTVSVWADLYNIFPLFYLNAITGTAAFLCLSRAMRSIRRKAADVVHAAVSFYGRNSLTALLTVNAMIFVVRKLLDKLGIFAGQPHSLYCLVTCVTVALLQIPVAHILNRPRVARIALLK